MQTGAADKRADLPQDALAQLLGREVAMFLHQCGKAVFAERVASLVHRLRHTVGEEKHDVADAKRLRHLLEQTLESLSVVDLQSEDETVRRLNLRLPGRRHLCRNSPLYPDPFVSLPPTPFPLQIYERTMTGTSVSHSTRAHIDHRVGHRDEAAGVEVLRDDAICPDQQLARRRVELAQ
jgi:hypothetical protein